MICKNCGEKVTVTWRHLKRDEAGKPVFFCSPKAERSEAAPRCPPSATGCPDARAVGQAGADSSGRCPEKAIQAARTASAILKEVAGGYRRLAADLASSNHEGGIVFSKARRCQQMAENLEATAADIDEAWPPDAPQRSGERALPGNAEVSGRRQSPPNT